MDALAALRLQLEWGADEALLPAPADRRRRPPADQKPSEARPQPSAHAAMPVPAAVAQARAAALQATDTAQLRAALTALNPGGLATTATSFVDQAGSAAGGLLLLGDVPHEAEDRSGVPFDGEPGQLLDRMLASIGLDRSGVLLATVLPWRPPGGRTPSEMELACCQPFLMRRIALAGIGRVLALGAVATRAMLGPQASLTRLRGHWAMIAQDDAPPGVQVLPTLHPSTLLARPAMKAQAWSDLRLLRRSIGEITHS
jgi:DNA polymerase